MDKLEKHIKQKLQERELKPSDAAWGKIESQLGNAKTTDKKIYWYAIAASFIGVLLISTAYFGSNIEKQTGIEVVVSDSTNTKEVLTKEIPEVEIIVTQEEMVQESINEPIEFKKNPLKSQKVFQQNIVLNENKEKAIFEEEQIAIGEQELIDNKLNQVLNMVTSLEQQNIEVTDTEIDSLLMAAQRELLTDEVFQENGKVDALALLTEAEDELDRTFRGQLFEKLKDGFFKVRTAVADRNN